MKSCEKENKIKRISCHEVGLENELLVWYSTLVKEYQIKMTNQKSTAGNVAIENKKIIIE